MAPPYCPGMNAMESLSMFPQILAELSVASLENTPKRFKLKFINMTLLTYDKIESSLRDYLETNLSSEVYLRIANKCKNLNEQSRICEMLVEIMKFCEETLDRHEGMFNEIFTTVLRVNEIAYDGTNFREQAIDKCSLLIYDSFVVLRSMHKKILEISKTYHVPCFYDTEEFSINLRVSLKTTFKNVCVIMDDYSIFSEALWFVRNYNFSPLGNLSESYKQHGEPTAADGPEFGQVSPSVQSSSHDWSTTPNAK